MRRGAAGKELWNILLASWALNTLSGIHRMQPPYSKRWEHELHPRTRRPFTYVAPTKALDEADDAGPTPPHGRNLHNAAVSVPVIQNKTSPLPPPELCLCGPAPCWAALSNSHKLGIAGICSQSYGRRPQVQVQQPSCVVPSRLLLKASPNWGEGQAGIQAKPRERVNDWARKWERVGGTMWCYI